MQVSANEVLTVLISLFGSGGIGYAVVKLAIKESARNALKDDITDLYNRLNKIDDEYVTCKFCNLQHNNLNNRLDKLEENIFKKLDNFDKKLDSYFLGHKEL